MALTTAPAAVRPGGRTLVVAGWRAGLLAAALIAVVACTSDAGEAPGADASAATSTTVDETPEQLQAVYDALLTDPAGCNPAFEDGTLTVTTLDAIAFCMDTLWAALVSSGAATTADVVTQRVEFDDFLFTVMDEAAPAGGPDTITACVGSQRQLQLGFTVTGGAGDSFALAKGACP